MGYVKLRSEITSSLIKAELSPANYLLKEISLVRAKNTLTKKLGLLDRSQIHRWYATTSPSMIAHFYPYIDDFKTLPFLQKIIFVSDSKINSAQFQLRIFALSDTGEPGDDLIEPLIGYAKKGRNYVTVDLTEQNFKMPDKGFFVAYEWLILEKNKAFFKTWNGQTGKKIKVVGYAPDIGSTLPGKGSINWIYVSGTWKKAQDNWDGKTLSKNLPVEELLFQLVLSN